MKQLCVIEWTGALAALAGGRYRLIVIHIDGDGKENTYCHSQVEVIDDQHDAIAAPTEDMRAAQAYLDSQRTLRRQNLAAVANAATFINYTPANTVPSTATTTSGANDWRDFSHPGAENTWNGIADINALLPPTATGTGRGMLTKITAPFAGQEFSVFACVYVRDSASTDTFGGLFARVPRGGTTELWMPNRPRDSRTTPEARWSWIYSDRETLDVHVLPGLAKVNGLEDYQQHMVYLGNFFPDKDAAIEIEFDDLSSAIPNLYLAGFALGEPLPDTLPRDSASQLLPDTHVVSEDGVWTWFTDPRAILLDSGNWLIGKLEKEGFSTVVHYDPVSRIPIATKISTETEQDDHNNVGLARSPDGMILAGYCKHGDSDWRWRKSTVPEPTSILDWGPEELVNNPTATYTNFLERSSGNVDNWFRRTGGASGRGWYFHTFTGAGWTSLKKPLVHSTSTTPPYIRVAIDSNDLTHFVTVTQTPNDVNGGEVRHFTFDGTTFFATNGDVIKTLAAGALVIDTELAAHPSTLISAPIAGQGNQWISSIAIDPATDRPVVLYNSILTTNDILSGLPLDRDVRDKIWAYRGEWNGTAWETEWIAHLGYGVSAGIALYPGEMILDPTKPSRCLIASCAESPFDAIREPAQNPTRSHEIYEGNRSAAGEWSWSRWTTTDANVRNMRPYIATNAAKTKAVAFWLQCEYGDDRTTNGAGTYMGFGSLSGRILARELT